MLDTDAYFATMSVGHAAARDQTELLASAHLERRKREMAIVYFRDEDMAPRGNWMPPVDVYETDGRDIVIKAELPDMTREDITVTVEHDTLTIGGEKKFSG